MVKEGHMGRGALLTVHMHYAFGLISNFPHLFRPLPKMDLTYVNGNPCEKFY